jgi:type II secretory pathway pseudopilin PulG
MIRALLASQGPYIFPRTGFGRRTDTGFTLVELLVYVSLLALVLFILGGMLISTLRVQNVVSSASEGTRLAQLISSSVGSGIRNATAFQIDTDAATKDQLLRSRSSVVSVSGGTTTETWRCMAWYWRASDGAFFATSSNSGLVPKPGTVSPAIPLSQWNYFGGGVASLTPPTPTPMPTPVPSPVPLTPVLSGSATELNLAFQVAGARKLPVQISTVYNLRVRSNITTGPTTCF